MKTNKEVSRLSYNELQYNYRQKDYFCEAAITIKYIKNVLFNGNGERSYKIVGLELDIQDDDERKEKLTEFINNCNDSIKMNKYPRDWQIFYLYKELFQILINDNIKYNYFRGQSDSYDLLPGILRKNVQNSYRMNFENLYKKISKEFPDKIEYVELKNDKSIEERESQLSILQHYGLKTSLLDITSNPYIALLFMLSESFDEYKEPSLFMFKIDENYDGDDYLFTEVRKDRINERIIAQKGAFLNFDKLCFNKKLKKIPLVKIVLQFSREELLNEIKSERKDLDEIESEINSSLKKEVDTQIIEDKSEFLKILSEEEIKIEDSKLECLNFIYEELSRKLREYYYFEEDLFPDFEKRIQYLSNKYQSESTKKLFLMKWSPIVTNKYTIGFLS